MSEEATRPTKVEVGQRFRYQALAFTVLGGRDDEGDWDIQWEDGERDRLFEKFILGLAYLGTSTPVTPQPAREEWPEPAGWTDAEDEHRRLWRCWPPASAGITAHADRRSPVKVGPGGDAACAECWAKMCGKPTEAAKSGISPIPTPTPVDGSPYPKPPVTPLEPPALLCRLGLTCTHHYPKKVEPYVPTVSDFDLLPDERPTWRTR